MTSRRRKFFFQRRGDSTSSHHCCVPNCTASAKCNSFLSFHIFPKDGELQKRWIINIKRDHFKITQKLRVCSRHFLPADLTTSLSPDGRTRLKRGAVPVLFEWNNYSLPSTRPSVWEQTEPSMNVQSFDHDYCSTSWPAAVVLDNTEALRSEISKLKRQIEETLIRSKFGVERFAASDDDIRFYTRFASYSHLMSFWSQIEPATYQIVRVTRASQTDDGGVNTTSLQPIDEFFLFMNYLSLGHLHQDLAHRFRIPQSNVSRIIITWASFLYTVLGAVCIWLDEETIRDNLPEGFHHYPDTHIILECIELRCQNPDSLLHQSVVNYKFHSTFKGLIGLAPHGPVTFVSPLFKDCLSDRELLKQSGIVALLKQTMAVMVNKDFHVKDCIPCKVHVPEISLRVHIKQIVQRVKKFELFSTVIHHSLIGSINQLFAVACLLINYQNGSIQLYSQNLDQQMLMHL